jgi:putative ABC transport system ATP-binding protein
MGAAIQVRNLNHVYAEGGPATLPVLKGVNLDVAAGDYVSLTGPSGAGKTTLLSILGGLEPPTSGEVTVGDHMVVRLKGEELAAFRRTTVGFVFQHFGLLPALTAAENVELALALSGVTPRARRVRAMQLLEAVGLTGRASHLPRALSGGEKQRVAIARATANLPGLILADEPTGNLDLESGNRVLGLLEDMRHQHGCSLIVVSHNPAVADRAAVKYRLLDGILEPA